MFGASWDWFLDKSIVRILKTALFIGGAFFVDNGYVLDRVKKQVEFLCKFSRDIEVLTYISVSSTAGREIREYHAMNAWNISGEYNGDEGTEPNCSSGC